MTLDHVKKNPKRGTSRGNQMEEFTMEEMKELIHYLTRYI